MFFLPLDGNLPKIFKIKTEIRLHSKELPGQLRKENKSKVSIILEGWLESYYNTSPLVMTNNCRMNLVLCKL